VIAEGKAADIVLFDYNTIADKSQFTDPHRFPTDTLRDRQRRRGVDNVVQTSAKPGKVLRS